MSAVIEYCTYFDHRFLPRGLALHASMRRHCAPFRLWVLCLDEECHGVLSALALPDVALLRLADLEARWAELPELKGTRPTVDYYYTLTPSLMAWLLEREPTIDVLTYLDADLYFFARPDFLLEEFKGHSTLIVPHNFSKRNHERLARLMGLYNVGWVSFRRGADGLACLEWWRKSCIEWCQRADTGLGFGDQMYLNEFPERFSGVYISRHPGVDVAPWNLDNFQLSASPDNAPRVDDQPIIFFHFSQVRRIASFLWRAPYSNYGAPVTRLVRSTIFRPYLREVKAGEKLVRRHGVAMVKPLKGERGLVGGSLRLILREIGALLWRGGGIWVLRS